MKKLLIPLSVMAVSGPLLLGATAADAATKWSYKSTNLSASADFSFTGTLEGFDGNVHLGHISGTEGRYASVSLSSWTCEEGSWPSDGYDDYGYGEYDDGCTFEDSVYYVSYDGEAEVDVDKKLTTGSITGTMTSYDYGYEYGGTSGEAVEVSLTFTGEGATSTTTEFSKDANYTYKYETTSRSATVSGTIGDLDLATADSDGSLRSTKEYERYNSN